MAICIWNVGLDFLLTEIIRLIKKTDCASGQGWWLQGIHTKQCPLLLVELLKKPLDLVQSVHIKYILPVLDSKYDDFVYMWLSDRMAPFVDVSLWLQQNVLKRSFRVGVSCFHFFGLFCLSIVFSCTYWLVSVFWSCYLWTVSQELLDQLIFKMKHFGKVSFPEKNLNPSSCLV